MMLTYIIVSANSSCFSDFFFFNDTATTEIYTLSLHDALPISEARIDADQIRDLVFGLGLNLNGRVADLPRDLQRTARSEEHTSELQSPDHLVCRLLLEKKKLGKEQPAPYQPMPRSTRADPQRE